MGVRIGRVGQTASPVDTHLLRQVQPKGGSGKLEPFDLVSIATLPRPVLLGVVGVVLLGAVFFVTHRPSETPATTPAPSQTPPAAESPTAKPGSSAKANEPSTGADKVTPENRSQTGPKGPGLPTRVKAALDSHKVVVILFWNRHGVDDRSVKKAIGHLPHRKQLAVFSDRVSHLSRYTRVTAAANVATTPSLVIVNRQGQAEVITGYLDRQTVGQYVRNALRR
jgi:hypothetical protein